MTQSILVNALFIHGLLFGTTVAAPATFQATQLRAQLYPYGPRAGDRVAEKNDDACTDMYIRDIVMFGGSFNRIYVCTNGDISLGQQFTSFTPEPFPLGSHTTLICPFWADADPRDGGDVYSRITEDSALLQRASHEVRNAYHTDSTFTARWSGVTAFGFDTHETNTFQAVLASDTEKTFVMFLYDQIEWTFGAHSYDIPAQVGFDAGNGRDYHAIPESRTPDVVNVPSKTNVGIPGVMVFKLSNVVDGGESGRNDTGIILPDAASTTPSTTTPLDVSCESHGNIYRVVHGTNCNQFTQSTENLPAKRHTCPQGLAFDVNHCVCNWPDSFVCLI